MPMNVDKLFLHSQDTLERYQSDNCHMRQLYDATESLQLLIGHFILLHLMHHTMR